MWKYYDRNEIDCQSIVHFVMQNTTNFLVDFFMLNEVYVIIK